MRHKIMAKKYKLPNLIIREYETIIMEGIVTGQKANLRAVKLGISLDIQKYMFDKTMNNDPKNPKTFSHLEEFYDIPVKLIPNGIEITYKLW